MNKLNITTLLLSIALLCGCATKKEAANDARPKEQKTNYVEHRQSLRPYKYAYIRPTNPITYSTQGSYDKVNKVYTPSTVESLNPADLIDGNMMKRGFVILPEIDPKLIDQTVVVNYGESGDRQAFLVHTTEITIQILSASTNEILTLCVVEKTGSSKADEIRNAINTAFFMIFDE